MPAGDGAFIALQHDVRAAGLADQVVFIEITVDPGRDTPARLAAYSARFDADWPLLTGTPANLDRLWKFFGVSHEIVPEDQPPKLDWWTGQPLTYDVDHTDGYILIDRQGHERFVDATPPNLHGRLDQTLTGLLNACGRQNLYHQTTDSWTLSQALASLGWRRPLAAFGGHHVGRGARRLRPANERPRKTVQSRRVGRSTLCRISDGKQ